MKSKDKVKKEKKEVKQLKDLKELKEPVKYNENKEITEIYPVKTRG